MNQSTNNTNPTLPYPLQSSESSHISSNAGRAVVPDAQSSRQEITINTKHPLVKKDNRAPFAKGFFLGQIDTELMAYPEILTGEQLATLVEEVQPIRKYFAQRKSPSTSPVDKQTMRELKDLRMFGLNIPQHLHGSGYFETEAEYASEAAGTDYALGSLLNCHRLVADLLNEYGTEEQRIRLLPKMASGEWVATVALFEEEGERSSSGHFQTTGALNVDGRSWKVRGRKAHVVNAKHCQWLLVGVQLEYRDYSGELKEGLGMFLVDKDSNGVVVEDSGNNNKSSVTLNDVVVGAENMLGTYENMAQVGLRLLGRSRLYDGHLATGLLRNTLSHSARVGVERRLGPVLVSERPLYQERAGQVCSEVFALESALHFVTGLLDGYHSPDVELECALVKSYASKQALKATLHSLNYAGQSCVTEGTDTQRLLQSAMDFQTHTESMDALRLYIGLMGLQYAGVSG